MTATSQGRVVRRYLLEAVRAQRAATLRATGWTALATLPALVQGWAVAHAIDDGFLTGRFGVGLAWLTIPLVATAPAAFGGARAVRAVGDVVEPFRDRLVEHVVGSTLERAVADPTGPARAASVARLVQQVEMVRVTLGGSITCLLGMVLTVIAAFLGQAQVAPDALLIMLPPVVLTLAGFLALLPAVLRRQRILVRGSDDLSATLEGNLSALRDVRAAGAAAWAARDCSVRATAQRDAARAAAGITALRLLLVGLGGRAPAALLLLCAPWLLRHGTAPGALAGSLTYALGTLSSSMQSLSDGISSQVVPLCMNLEHLLADPPTAGSASQPTEAPAAPVVGGRAADGPPAVLARRVGFAYGPHAEPVVHDLDLTVVPGEHLAIVGASGIGKSTLISLISGMLAPTAGSVRVGGVDPARLAVEERMHRYVLIPQEAYVFTAELGENLRHLCPNATDADLDRAVEAVGMSRLRDRIGGYEAVVRPDSLSGGERQLIALTRAWLSPAPLALLDEATCHLDPTAEEMAEQAFARRRGTLIVVAHRITSARRADRILVLDGTAAVSGTHDYLLERSPLYRNLAGHWGHEPVEQTTEAARETTNPPEPSVSLPWRVHL